MPVAVGCSKDLSGHWLLLHPPSLILVALPDPVSTALTYIRLLMFLYLVTVSSVRILYHRISNVPLQKAITRLAWARSVLTTVEHVKAMYYHGKRMGLRDPVCHMGQPEWSWESCIVSFLIWSSWERSPWVLTVDSITCRLYSVTEFLIVKMGSVLGTISYQHSWVHVYKQLKQHLT